MATLGEAYSTLFPYDQENPFSRAPLLPTDIFAYTAHLVERAGAYHHIVPKKMGPSDHLHRKLIVDARLRRRTMKLGKLWRRARIAPGRLLPSPPPEVDRLWKRLGKFQDSSVFESLPDWASAPPWWRICLELLMIADEACSGIGFNPNHPFYVPVLSTYGEHEIPFASINSPPFSLSTAADDVVCVQAKSRTPSVGCTLRSLSHNLALLPARGQVRARWMHSPFSSEREEEKDTLGLLLVPFPYRVEAEAFVPSDSHKNGWGWFSVDPKWLRPDRPRSKNPVRTQQSFADFIVDLVAKARGEGKRIDGVVLPELALDHAHFVTLARTLARDVGIDFLVSGISKDEHGRPGNFVAIAPFFVLGKSRKARQQSFEQVIQIREKHHRWRLNKQQIDDYDLSTLKHKDSWWEEITILSRRVDVLVYRGMTTLTTLICEDLARVDPCQAAIRAIGPNLLIALLMDGPQFGSRWPGRYATVLAEDPGTSVLSFTSFGLVARQNKVGTYPMASSVALWKDDVNVRQLELPRESDALVLELKTAPRTEHTLDGRSDGGTSHSWRYLSHSGVRATRRRAWIRSGATV